MKKNMKVVEETNRVKELLGLNTGAIIGRIADGALDLILGENMAILTSGRATFIHYAGSPEYELYAAIIGKTGLMTELDPETAAAFKDMMLLTPSIYFYMHENTEFHSHCAMQFLSALQKGMEEAISKMDNDPDAAQEYINEQRTLNVVLGMLENDLAEVKSNTSNLTPPKHKRARKTNK